MSAQHGEVACAAVPSMSEQVLVVRGSLPSPNIPSSAAVLLSAPKQMQSPQVSGSKCWPSTQPQPAGYVPGRPTQRPQGDMLPPATWSPDGPREGGDNNLARQLYFSQMLPPGGASQSMRGEVGQGDVEEELKKAEEERRELHRQLEALNLQHREAQGKLQSMQQQQQQGPGVKRQSVSPSISPISHVMTEDEQCSVSGEKQRAGDMWEAVSGRNTAREITVSLPRVEMINANSPLSPEDGRPSMPAVRPSEPRYNVTAVQAM